MLPLLAIPVVAVVAGIALAAGLFGRRPVVVAAAVSLAGVAGFVGVSFRDVVSAPAAVDSLVMLLPLALVAGALPYLVRMAPVAVHGLRALRRRLPAAEPVPVTATAE